MWQRFTEPARRAVFFAQEEAARLGENYVGTEHLLLGLTRLKDSTAARILDLLGVSLGRIRADIERQVTRGHGNLGQDMQLTPRAKRVIDIAYNEAQEARHGWIGPEHLLLGLIREGDGLAARVLIKLGANLDRTRAIVQDLPETAYRSPGGAVDRAPAVPPATLAATLRSPEETLQWLRTFAEGATVLELHQVGAAIVTVKRFGGEWRDLVSIRDLTTTQAELLLELARLLKKFGAVRGKMQLHSLLGKTVAMLFEKPSLRTRVTFEAGMTQLGGHAIYLQPSDVQLGQRESVADAAKNLERWVDGIVARTFKHETVVELAQHSRVPVINALSDHEHPCQALADFLTIREKVGETKGVRIAVIGDGNNVAHSLMRLGARLGSHVVVACPPGYEPDGAVTTESAAVGTASGGSVTVIHDPREAARDAQILYTDVWASMGQEAEAEARAKLFQPFQLNAELLKAAKPDALVMHCLPAHRGQEITDDVIDGPQSIVFDQAENRLHAQKALLAALL
jgi:ornithine carbamoyltransferase